MKTNMVHSLLPDTFFNTPPDRLFGRLFEDFFSDNTLDPQTGYEEWEDKYQLRVAVPGLSKKDLQLRLEDNVLYLSGEARQMQQSKDASAIGRRRFKRSFVLPDDVDLLRIKARCQHGLLTVTLCKSRPVREAKRIPVRGENATRSDPDVGWPKPKGVCRGT